jgi:ADP-ribosylglycohydrolase
MVSIPSDYDERVYAGWVGKCIGVRFGAPLEGWTYDDIRSNLGTVDTYLNEAPGKLFKPDDDTALPMILIRALQDAGASPDLTAQQVADAWLNYLGDQQGTLWWGGYGTSTEHTAYLNLASGIPAPRSGSTAQNGAALAEQIGGQIFSDIWGLVAPGDPALAADLAARASSVSHDGNGIYGGRFIAALVSAAFTEPDPLTLIEIGLSLVPAESEFARVTRAMVDFYSAHPGDWHACYAYLKANFGYDRYPGEVHIIPNAGVVAMALAYGEGDFTRTIQIANMAGWDTDCNVGNVGAIMGVAVGLDGIEWRWREPMNDLLVAASIIGTRNLLTIPQCADLFCTLGRALAGGPAAPARPRYHFHYPGSTSNFHAEGERGRVIELRQSMLADPNGTLQASVRKLNKKGELRIYTDTYLRPGMLNGNYYGATFTPLIHPGQTVTAEVFVPADAPDNLHAGLFVYDDNYKETHQSPGELLAPGAWHTLRYTVPELAGACLSRVGVVVRNLGENWETGAFHLRALDWSGDPAYAVDFARERAEGSCISQWTKLRGYWRLEDGAYHGSGIGLCETYTGDIIWRDYTVTAVLIPLIGDHHYVNVRVQGAQRSYACGLGPDGTLAIYRKQGQDYERVAEAAFAWHHGARYTLRVTAQESIITVEAHGDEGRTVLAFTDPAPYLSGQIGLSTWHGSHTRCEALNVAPAVGEMKA